MMLGGSRTPFPKAPIGNAGRALAVAGTVSNQYDKSERVGPFWTKQSCRSKVETGSGAYGVHPAREGCEIFIPKPGQIESGINLPHQIIFRNRVAKMKLVEQLTLVTLQTAHHGST
jgi:hypothetical protein